MVLVLLAVTWVLCGVVTIAAWRADFQGSFPRLYTDYFDPGHFVKNDSGGHASGLGQYLVAACGPIGLLVVVIVTDGFRHGFTFRVPDEQILRRALGNAGYESRMEKGES